MFKRFQCFLTDGSTVNVTARNYTEAARKAVAQASREHRGQAVAAIKELDAVPPPTLCPYCTQEMTKDPGFDPYCATCNHWSEPGCNCDGCKEIATHIDTIENVFTRPLQSRPKKKQMPAMTPYNRLHDTLIRVCGCKMNWQQPIKETRSRMECWTTPQGILMVQVWDRDETIQLYAGLGIPNNWDELTTWLSASPASN